MESKDAWKGYSGPFFKISVILEPNLILHYFGAVLKQCLANLMTQTLYGVGCDGKI
jgi:hypothetical protein